MLVERKMPAGALKAIDVRRQDAAQMALVEDHETGSGEAESRIDGVLKVSAAWLEVSSRRPPQ
jgi:hypothetical protein